MESDKLCAIVIPYFGKLHNYFQLFLNSCEKNEDYEWLLFTDDKTEYLYPTNVKVIPFSLKRFKNLAEKKMGISVELDSPYKLCDFKPTYGLVFEDYLKGYKYWGHCDCDLLFGDLTGLVSPILQRGYDKIFAAGHLTIYKNEPMNNRRFMKKLDGREVYKEALQTPEIYVFDEDFTKQKNPHGLNVQDIFLRENTQGYYKDLSFNVSGLKARFHRAYYCFEERRFKRENYMARRYYWNDGKVITWEWNGVQNNWEVSEYIYIHLQMRKMKVCKNVLGASIIEILPDRFRGVDFFSSSKSRIHFENIKFLCGYYFAKLNKKIRKIFS